MDSRNSSNQWISKWISVLVNGSTTISSCWYNTFRFSNGQAADRLDKRRISSAGSVSNAIEVEISGSQLNSRKSIIGSLLILNEFGNAVLTKLEG